MSVYLGIDTSCYTTSVAAVDEQGHILADCRKPLVVPQGARGLRQSDMVFQHVNALPRLISDLRSAIGQAPITAVAASTRPRDVEGSYMPVFAVSAAFGKSVSAALNAPYIETTHQQGHIAAGLYGQDGIGSKFFAFHLSGGTTEMLDVSQDSISIKGATKDISAGQLVDRIGVKMGLPFPAGPHLESLANGGVVLPVKVSVTACDCSFSGVEAQLMRLIDGGKANLCDIAATAYQAIAATLSDMLRAVNYTGDVLFTGGVVASERLKGLLTDINIDSGACRRYFFAEKALAGDNAVGVALIAREMGE